MVGSSSPKGEGRADPVCVSIVATVELGGLNLDTEGSPHTRAERLSVAESEDTAVVDLRLDERGRVEVDLGTDLERDVARGRRAGVVHGLGAGLDVGADAVVVARGVRGEVGEPVEGDGVLGGRVANGGRVLCDLALGHVV